MDYLEIFRENSTDSGDPLAFPPEQPGVKNFSFIFLNILTSIGWIGLKFGTKTYFPDDESSIHVPFRINCHPLIFHPAPPSDHLQN